MGSRLRRSFDVEFTPAPFHTLVPSLHRINEIKAVAERLFDCSRPSSNQRTSRASKHTAIEELRPDIGRVQLLVARGILGR